jgi:hypothetical protein
MRPRGQTAERPPFGENRLNEENGSRVLDLPANLPREIRASVVIAYATGEVVRQADCELIEAFDRLAARARVTGQSLEHTALDVLDGIISFHTETI